MEVKKIVEGMTAPEVAQVIDENFNGLNAEKATVEAVADVQRNVNRSDDNTGVLSYPVFDDTESVEVGAVRRYEGLLYRAKVAGANYWDPEKWERVTLKQLEDEKLSELPIMSVMPSNHPIFCSSFLLLPILLIFQTHLLQQVTGPIKTNSFS